MSRSLQLCCQCSRSRVLIKPLFKQTRNFSQFHSDADSKADSEAKSYRDSILEDLKQRWDPDSTLTADDTDWIPDAPQRELLFSLHKALKSAKNRLNCVETLNDTALSSLEWKTHSMQYLFGAGYARQRSQYNAFLRKSRKSLLGPLQSMVTRLEQMQNSVICRETMQWVVNWPPIFSNIDSSDEYRSSLQWPKLLRSPSYEVGSVLWHSELRIITFGGRINQRYKLGIFVGPKSVANADRLADLKGKLEMTVAIKYRLTESQLSELAQLQTGHYVEHTSSQSNADDESNLSSEETVQNQNVVNMDPWREEEISFSVTANFVKKTHSHTDNRKLMSWGKFIPILSDVIDEETGNVNYENVQIVVSFRVVEQTLTYDNQLKLIQ